MTTIELPVAFEGLFRPNRYKAFFGGRGSAKSHSVAAALLARAAESPHKVLCARELQKSIKESSKALLDAKINELGLSSFFTSLETEIRGKNGSQFIFSGLKSNPESIKSTEGITLAWIEEANKVSRKSLDLLIPTVRAPASEIWFTWNPVNEFDPVELMFRGENVPPSSLVKRVSWRDNPYFPHVLRDEMEYLRKTDPLKAAHVWDGEYEQVVEGAYYAAALAEMASNGRIGRVDYEPRNDVITGWDFGMGDATCIWFAQVVGSEIRLIDYYYNDSQPLTHYIQVVKDKPYSYGLHYLPHDAGNRQLGHTAGKSYSQQLSDAGMDNVVLGRTGDVRSDIDFVMSWLPKVWIDVDKCADGLRGLRAYRRNYDPDRRIVIGPYHDWASNHADALRSLAMALMYGGKGVAGRKKVADAYTRTKYKGGNERSWRIS